MQSSYVYETPEMDDTRVNSVSERQNGGRLRLSGQPDSPWPKSCVQLKPSRSAMVRLSFTGAGKREWRRQLKTLFAGG